MVQEDIQIGQQSDIARLKSSEHRHVLVEALSVDLDGTRATGEVLPEFRLVEDEPVVLSGLTIVGGSWGHSGYDYSAVSVREYLRDSRGQFIDRDDNVVTGNRRVLLHGGEIGYATIGDRIRTVQFGVRLEAVDLVRHYLITGNPASAADALTLRPAYFRYVQDQTHWIDGPEGRVPVVYQDASVVSHEDRASGANIYNALRVRADGVTVAEPLRGDSYLERPVLLSRVKLDDDSDSDGFLSVAWRDAGLATDTVSLIPGRLIPGLSVQGRRPNGDWDESELILVPDFDPLHLTYQLTDVEDWVTEVRLRLRFRTAGDDDEATSVLRRGTSPYGVQSLVASVRSAQSVRWPQPQTVYTGDDLRNLNYLTYSLTKNSQIVGIHMESSRLIDRTYEVILPPRGA